jgi:predicted acetyltransferase
LRHELNERLLQMGGHIGYEIRPSRRRQGYGKLILKYGLEQAKAFGLERVLLTCDEDNLGSRKIIESNGGRLEKIIEVEGWPEQVCRYWIYL